MFIERDKAKPRKWIIYHRLKKEHMFVFSPEDEFVFFAEDRPGVEGYIESLCLSQKYHIQDVQYPKANIPPSSWLRDSHQAKYQLRLNEKVFCDTIDKYQIDSFYSYATFHKLFIQMREVLLSEKYFPKVQPLWNGDPFLDHPWMDWMGTLQYSTLANININSLPEINDEQEELLDDFITNTFMPQKMNSTYYSYREGADCNESEKKFIQSKEELQDLCKTTKPIAILLMQVIGDTALVITPDEQFYDCTWAVDFIEKHPEIFFIIKDHPFQNKIFPKHPHRDFWNKYVDIRSLAGKRALYIPPDEKYETLTLSMHADLLVTFNSRAGFDSLYWTPVVAAGERYRHREICYYLDDFHLDAPPKKRSDILKYMYYTITRCLCIPDLNCTKSNYYKWIEWTNDYRLSVGTNQTNLKQATIEELQYLIG